MLNSTGRQRPPCRTSAVEAAATQSAAVTLTSIACLVAHRLRRRYRGAILRPSSSAVNAPCTTTFWCDSGSCGTSARGCALAPGRAATSSTRSPTRDEEAERPASAAILQALPLQGVDEPVRILSRPLGRQPRPHIWLQPAPKGTGVACVTPGFNWAIQKPPINTCCLKCKYAPLQGFCTPTGPKMHPSSQTPKAQPSFVADSSEVDGHHRGEPRSPRCRLPGPAPRGAQPPPERPRGHPGPTRAASRHPPHEAAPEPAPRPSGTRTRTRSAQHPLSVAEPRD
jgi:hypothetical protein